MKKLYRKGSTVHPSPPMKPDHLSFLPATILTLAVALSPEDREVLAYLISCSSSSNFSGNNRSKNSTSKTISTGVDHPPSFNCYCFRCYMSYWVRWDSSSNRQLIHEIIDAYEDGFSMQSKREKSGRKDRRKISGKESSVESGELKRAEPADPNCMEYFTKSSSEKEIISEEGDDVEEEEEEEEEETGKGAVRRFVSFLGEKIWGFWA